MKDLFNNVVLFIFVASLNLGMASADTEIIIQSEQENAPEMMYIANDKLYMSTDGNKIIVDPVAEHILILDDQQKQYMEIDEAFFDQLGDMLGMAQLPPEMLEQLPPEQRAALMEQLGQQKPKADKAAAPAINKTGETKQVSGISCEIYQVKSENSAGTSVCVAKRAAAKMNSADYQTLMNIGEFTKAISAKIANSMPEMVDAVDVSLMQLQMPGIPMEVIDNGSVTKIISITEKTIDTSAYNTAGYKKTDIGQMFSK